VVTNSLFLVLLEHVCQVALAAVLTIEVLSHEDTSTTVLVHTFAAHAGHLVGGIDLVVLEHMKLDLLLGVLHLLWLSVGLLLTLLASSTETQDKVQGGLLLDVVILQGAPILELLTSEDETLLIRGNSFLVLDLGFHILNGVGLLHVQGNRLAGEGFDEDLHTTTQAEDQVEGGLFLNVVVLESSAVFKLLTSEDEALLIRRDSFLVLNLGLNVLDGV